jgi:hypothetical protein
MTDLLGDGRDLAPLGDVGIVSVGPEAGLATGGHGGRGRDGQCRNALSSLP